LTDQNDEKNCNSKDYLHSLQVASSIGKEYADWLEREYSLLSSAAIRGWLMSSVLLVFVLGIIWVQHWSRLPDSNEWLILIAISLICGLRRYWIVCAWLLGVIWACVFASWRVSDRLADDLQGRDVQVQGFILSLPQHQDIRLSFDFYVTESQPGIPRKLRLNWYKPSKVLQAGQTWQMTVRLKQPHGRSNPGGFDYEAWLFANHIGATGYVRPHPEASQIESMFTISRYFAVLRQRISNHLDAALPGSKQLGVIKALTIGSQDLISQEQWTLFRKTGIVHLIVISGSHISLIAGLVFFLVRRVWARWGGLQTSPQNLAALLAWLAALTYAALAGFSIPTQRAVLMLTVGLWAIVSQRHTAPLQVLWLALLFVVGFDPLAVLSVGFWLSFISVALLIFISTGRLGKSSYWRETFKLHLAMAIGLAPLLIVFFQQVSLISPLANWVAVPLVGLLATPLALLATGLSIFSSQGAALLLWPVDQLLQGLEWLLQLMIAWPVVSISCSQPPWYSVALAGVGVILLLAPKGMPGRYLSPCFFLPLFFVATKQPRPGEVWLTLLDVGQGLATVIQTEQHTLVFDAGAQYSEQSDMGESVVLPFLRYQGIRHLDMLMISHGDNDHSGGAASLLANLPVTTISSSVKNWADLGGGQYCQAGQRWEWDGVQFTVLSPDQQIYASENDQSCVLKIMGSNHSFLLTGDIEQAAETRLVDRYGETLHSSVLIAPHHGSKTSSSLTFLEKVKPSWVLIPAGHMNRFGFPHPQVLKRYQNMNLKSFSAGENGAISVKTSEAGLDVKLSRQETKRYWMRDVQ